MATPVDTATVATLGLYGRCVFLARDRVTAALVCTTAHGPLARTEKLRFAGALPTDDW